MFFSGQAIYQILFAFLYAPITFILCCDISAISSNTSPEARDGWEYRLVTNGLTKPRGIALDDEGGLLVVESGVGVTRLVLDDKGGTCISSGERTEVIRDPELNHGIALDGPGGILYASSADRVYSWSYNVPAGTVNGNATVVIENMDNSGHSTRTLHLTRKEPGLLLVSRGSNSNEDLDAKIIESGHCQIKAYLVGGSRRRAEPYDFVNDGNIIGWGLRNSVGIAEHPETGDLWSVENSIDQLERMGVDIHNDNPGEELNYHGPVNMTSKNTPNFGYPSCFAFWSTQDFPSLGDLEIGDQFSPSPDSSLNDTTCNTDFVSPALTFQAHSAPLDITFSSSGDDAFISFHGSWNRKEPVGYKVSRVSFKNGVPAADRKSATAAEDIFVNRDPTSCPTNCFRPVGLALDQQGRLFVSSDSTGEIFVLQATGEGGSLSSAADHSAVVQRTLPSGLYPMVVSFSTIILLLLV